jgi:hypothetical protein
MSFFNKLFSKSDDQGSSNAYIVKFGRYTDRNKTEANLTAWDNAVKLFNEKNYFLSFKEFFNYVKDESIGNVSYEVLDNRINFQFIQGSKIISGTIENNKVLAETFLAKYNDLNVAFLRKLMNMNYYLQYTRFALKDDKICYKFDSTYQDASPNKLYYSLKELAVQSDKQDDLLVDEFNTLEKLGTSHIIEIPERIKDAKYKYFTLWVDKTLERVSGLDEDKNSGAITFLLLALAFKIDFLIKPEGVISDSFEKMQTAYFAKDNKTYIEKNRILKDEIAKVRAIPREDFLKNIYDVKSTFGIVVPSTHKQVYDFVLQEMAKTDWYEQNNMPDIVIAVYEYIVGYSFFNFGMQYPSTDFLTLFYNITNQEYFKEIGFNKTYISSDNQRLDKNNIEDKIREVLKKGKKDFPKLDFLTNNLRYADLKQFAKSYLNEFTYLNYSK